jgi:hypothetical protein
MTGVTVNHHQPSLPRGARPIGIAAQGRESAQPFSGRVMVGRDHQQDARALRRT